MAAIRGIESTAMTLQEPQPGLEDLMGYLEKRGVRRALCTRNFESVMYPYPPSLYIGYRGNSAPLAYFNLHNFQGIFSFAAI